MSDSLVAVRECGCMTAWLSLEHSTPGEVKRFYADAAATDREVRKADVEEVRAKGLGCEHEPPREPQPYKPRVRWTKVTRGGGHVRRVYVITPWSRGFPVGDACKRDGKWWITEGWFDHDGPGAHYGDDPCGVEGPFNTQREAGERLAQIAMQKSRAMYVESHGEDAADERLRYDEALV